jgi:hypothetical protein
MSGEVDGRHGSAGAPGAWGGVGGHVEARHMKVQ